MNKKKTKKKIQKKTAYFAGGCFWGLESKFKRVKGVIDTDVGFMGDVKKATYEQVSKGNTNHAETVKVIYNSRIITYHTLLKKFFTFHDPTTLDKQGPDIGKQYRSIAFFSTKQEQDSIHKYINKSTKNIVTEVLRKKRFYKANNYHQDYNDKILFNKICKNNTTLAEPKFSGIYTKEPYISGKIKGKYICPQCKSPLYNSKDAFDSNTGWPAFSNTIDKKGLSISKYINFNKSTKEVTCKKCGLHLGHRFIKGNKIHDCINSICLEFKQK